MKTKLIIIFLFFNKICFAQDLLSGGTNSWLFHTPDDGRTTMWIVPMINNDWSWGTATQFMNNGNAIFSNKLGIGTNSPQTQLHIQIPEQDKIGLTIHGNSVNTDNTLHFVGLSFDGDYGNGTGNVSQIRSLSNLYACWGSSLTFHTTARSSANTLLERMRINYDGNVGIGTTNPIEPLHIEKSINGELNFLIKNTYGSGTRTFLTSTPDRSLLQTDKDFGIWTNGTGWAERFTVKNNGYVGIGTTNPSSMLTVAGKIDCREVNVTVNAGADFVFEENYPIKSIEEVEAYIKENKHLPEIAPANEMEANGIELGNMNIKLLQKVEELTLYLIEQNKKIKDQSTKIKEQDDLMLEQNKMLKEQIELLKAQQEEIKQLKKEMIELKSKN